MSYTYIMTGFLLFSLFSGFLVEKNAYSATGEADFEYTADGKLATFTVKLSQEAETYTLNFGDGSDTTVSKTDTVIHYNYSQTGSYNVCLNTLSTDNVVQDTRCKTIKIRNGFVSSENEDFSYYVDTFYDKINMNVSSYIDNYADNMVVFWNFDDRKTSMDLKPSFDYSGSGRYKVSLQVRDTVENRNYSVTKHIRIGDICRADFDYRIKTDSIVAFSNNSNRAHKYLWSFGDGHSSENKNPKHTYTRDGVYKVHLTVRDTTTECMDRYSEQIRVGDGKVDCHADFDYSMGLKNHKVYFENTSLGKADKAYWVFGDGTVSHKMNPVKSFSQTGFYNIRLFIKSSQTGCMDKTSQNLLIYEQGKDLKAHFIYHVEGKTLNLYNRSRGDTGLQYTWNMGNYKAADNKAATVHHKKNTEYTYDKPGYYRVCLNVKDTNSQMSDMQCQKIRIGKPDRDCNADFDFMIDSVGPSRWDVDYSDQSFSTGKITQRSWYFSDTVIQENQLSGQKRIYDSCYYKMGLMIKDDNGCVSREYKLLNVGARGRLQGQYSYRKLETVDLKSTGYPVDFVGISHGDAAKLKWDFEGDGTWEDSTSTNPTYVYEEAKTYYPRLMVTDPNTGETDIYIDTVNVGKELGIDAMSETNDAMTLNIRPNPVQEFAHVHYTLPREMQVRISLYDIRGQKIRNLIQGTKAKGSHRAVISRGDLATGLYHVYLKTRTGSKVKQLLMIE